MIALIEQSNGKYFLCSNPRPNNDRNSDFAVSITYEYLIQLKDKKDINAFKDFIDYKKQSFKNYDLKDTKDYKNYKRILKYPEIFI